MEERLTRVTARILGEDYTIRGRMPAEHIERVARYVDEKMLQIAEAYPKLGTSRVAVLAAINMADELFKIREQYDQLTQLLEEEWSQRRQAAAADEPARPSGRSGRLPEAGAPEPGVEVASDRDAGGPGRKAHEPGREAGDRQLFTGDALAGQAGWKPPPEDEDQ
ncbi:MAG: cell division protein ZapA [Bacillota bacterium]